MKLKQLVAGLCALLLSSLASTQASFVPKNTIPASKLASASYATWAHSHQVWLASGVANQTNEIQLVKDYLAHDIPVGGVDIDSQWSTADNNFVFNTQKYPDPKGMIDFFHSNNIRVVLWATSFLNTDAPTFNYAKSQGYLLNGGRTIKWWHGEGGLIDYSNPDATKWWHQQLDLVLNIGVDGFKTDGSDFNILEYVVAYGKKGIISHREYADYYYRDFYYYPKTKNPFATLWARPCDSYGTPVCIQFAPQDVMHSGWVGDQKGSWDGIKAALFNFVHSAWQNFANYGSDIGGYLNGDKSPQGRTKELFIRWAQLGAFSPHMENGGNGEHRPWMFDVGGNSSEILNVYRTFVHIHEELIPYLLNAGTTALANKTSVMFPMAPKTDILTISNYDFKLWHDIFVSPIVNGNVSVQQVTFPKHDNWVDWWNPSIVFNGGSKVNYPVPMFANFPVFQRQGSVIPINVTREYAGHGSRASNDALTLLFAGIDLKRNSGSAVIRGEYPDGISQEVSYTYEPNTGTLRTKASSHPRNLILLFRSISKCGAELNILDNIYENQIRSVGETSSGSSLRTNDIESLLKITPNSRMMQQKLRQAGYGFWFDTDRSELWVRPGASKFGIDISITCIRNM